MKGTPNMAVHSEQMARFLVELGERTPQIQSIVQEADAARWGIELEDDLLIVAELDKGRGRLSLEADLGRPPDEHRLATCEALLLFTSLEHASDNVAMALSEPEGEFQLCGHVAVPDFDPTKLESTLLAFADRALQWREVVARGARQDSASNEVFSPAALA